MSVIEEDLSTDEFVVIRLSDENKRDLFQEVCSEFAQRNEDCEPLLARLNQLNENIARDFAPKELGLEKVNLRLIFWATSPIVKALRKDPPESLPVQSYIVVSYCWHDQHSQWRKADESRLDPWPFGAPMVHSLLDALQGGEDSSEGVWIDERCIRQADDEDKINAIAAMDVIYRSARRMVILLEDVQITAEEQTILTRWHAQVYPAARDLKSSVASRDGPSLEANERVLMAGLFLKILSARWFRRAWCGHELKVSRYPLKLRPADTQTMHLYGPEKKVIKINIMFLNNMLIQFQQDIRSADVEPIANVEKQRQLIDVYARVLVPSILQENDGMALPRQPLTAGHMHISSYDCTVPRDRITILLNTCGIPLMYKRAKERPQPSDDELYFIVALLSLASDEASVLDTSSGEKPEHARGLSETRWFRRPKHRSLWLQLRDPELRLEETLHKVDMDWIELDILVIVAPSSKPPQHTVDQVMRVSNQEALETGLDFIFRETFPEIDRLPAEDREDILPMMQKHFKKFMGYFITDCSVLGMPWAESLLAALDREGDEPTPAKPELLPLAMSTYILQQYINSNSEAPDPPSRSASAILVLQRLLYIVGSVVFKKCHQYSRVDISTLEKHSAFTEPFDSLSTFLAVPAAFAHSKFGYLNRGWWLQTEGTNCKLVHKTILVGCPTLTANGETIQLMKRQRIYGGETLEELQERIRNA